LNIDSPTNTTLACYRNIATVVVVWIRGTYTAYTLVSSLTCVRYPFKRNTA